MKKIKNILDQSIEFESIVKKAFWKSFKSLVTGTRPMRVPPGGTRPIPRRVPQGFNVMEATPTGPVLKRGIKEISPGVYELEPGFKINQTAGTIEPIKPSLPPGYSPESGGMLAKLTDAELLSLYDTDLKQLQFKISDLDKLPDAWKKPDGSDINLTPEQIATVQSEVRIQNQKIRDKIKELKKIDRSTVRGEAWSELKGSKGFKFTAGTSALIGLVTIYKLFSNDDPKTDSDEKKNVINKSPLSSYLAGAPNSLEVIKNLNSLLAILNSVMNQSGELRSQDLATLNNFIRETRTAKRSMENFAKLKLDLDDMNSVQQYIINLNSLEEALMKFNVTLMDISDIAAKSRNMKLLSIVNQLDEAFSEYSNIITKAKSLSASDNI
jgi:hypothetical protein